MKLFFTSLTPPASCSSLLLFLAFPCFLCPSCLASVRHPEDVPVALVLNHVEGASIRAGIYGMQRDVSYTLVLEAIIDGSIVFSRRIPVETPSIRFNISDLPLGVNMPTISCKVYDDHPSLSASEALLASVQKQLPISFQEPPFSDETSLSIACARQKFAAPAALECCSTESLETTITLASIGSMDRAVQMLHVMVQWDGPSSLVFYAKSEEERQLISAFVRETMLPAAARQCHELILLLLWDCHDQRSPERVFPFPVNKLRSEAISSAPTDLVLYIDVDFLPSADAATQLQRAFSSPSFDQSASLLVLPAFLSVWSSPWPSRLRLEGEQVDVQRLHMEELKRRCLTGDVFPPEMPFGMTPHGATDYLKWFHQPANSSVPYHVPYRMWYEPYFVINRRLWKGKNRLGLFDERFVDAGPDKVELAYEAAVLGYAFFVHPTAFLVHVPERREFFCDEKFPALCKKRNEDKTSWKDKTNYFSNFQFIDFVFSLPRWVDHRVPEGFSRPCFIIPFASITELSRRELFAFLFPLQKVRMVWTCARDRCERVHEKFMLWQGHFLPPPAFQQPPDDLQQQSFREAFDRWCFNIPPLVGIYFIRAGRVFIQYDSLLLNGDPDAFVNASHMLHTNQGDYALDMFEDAGTSTAEVSWENECFRKSADLPRLVSCRILSEVETRLGRLEVVLRLTYLRVAP